MSASADILAALLDKIPAWKALKDIPARVASLEDKVADLESKPIIPAEDDDPCPEMP